MLQEIQNKEIFEKIRILSNPLRFKIVELTQKQELNVTKLSSMLKLSYNKCVNYISMLEKLNLITKTRQGKEVLITSKIQINNDKIVFS